MTRTQQILRFLRYEFENALLVTRDISVMLFRVVTFCYGEIARLINNPLFKLILVWSIVYFLVVWWI